MICRKCGCENAGSAEFCVRCGESMSRVCPSCGAYVPSTEMFCASCGGLVSKMPITQGSEANKCLLEQDHEPATRQEVWKILFRPLCILGVGFVILVAIVLLILRLIYG